MFPLISSFLWFLRALTFALMWALQRVMTAVFITLLISSPPNTTHPYLSLLSFPLLLHLHVFLSLCLLSLLLLLLYTLSPSLHVSHSSFLSREKW